ncbi:MAG: hypothetical protein AAF212_09390 [Verrucomicrobiota bacterium]
MADALDRFPVFFGTFERRFDSKRRIALPSEWIPNPKPDYFLGFFEPGERLLRVYPKQFIDHLRNYTEAVIESDREVIYRHIVLEHREERDMQTCAIGMQTFVSILVREGRKERGKRNAEMNKTGERVG